MAIAIGPSDGGDEDEVVSSINTTPLVDVMLVLLIIFLITIPVVTHTIKVQLPKDLNQPTQTKPHDVTIAVTEDGKIYWDQQLMSDNAQLLSRLEKVAVLNPQPKVHIRGDGRSRFESVGRVVTDCQRAGIFRVGFITEPPPHGG